MSLRSKLRRVFRSRSIRVGKSVHSRNRRLQLESLEARRVLYGVTFVTHGWTFDWDTGIEGSWVEDYGNLIACRARNSVACDPLKNSDNLLAITIGDLKDANHNNDHGPYLKGPLHYWNTKAPVRATDAFQSAQNSELVVLLDWTEIAGGRDGELPVVGETRTTELAEFVYAYLKGSNPELFQAPWHIIGHSRGASLAGAFAELLGKDGVWVDQVTFLDAHPLANGLGEADDDWGDKGMVKPPNVAFADAYYRYDWNPTDFDGEPVTGALNTRLNEAYFDNTDGSGVSTSLQAGISRISQATWDRLEDGLPEWKTPGNVRDPGSWWEHSDVWAWYGGTIPETLPSPLTIDKTDDITEEWYPTPSDYCVTDLGDLQKLVQPQPYTIRTEDELAAILGPYLDNDNVICAYGQEGDQPQSRETTGYYYSRIVGGDRRRHPLGFHRTDTHGPVNVAGVSAEPENTVRSPGESLEISYAYDTPWSPSSTPALSFYLDTDQNPYNNESSGAILIGARQLPGFVSVTYDSSKFTLPDDVEPGSYFVLVKGTAQSDDFPVRYAYSRHPIRVTRSAGRTVVLEAGVGGDITDDAGNRVDLIEADADTALTVRAVPHDGFSIKDWYFNGAIQPLQSGRARVELPRHFEGKVHVTFQQHAENSIQLLTQMPYVMPKGARFAVTWESTNLGGDVAIDLYRGSQVVQRLSSDIPILDGVATIRIPNDSDLATGTDYRIRISSQADASKYSESRSFRIVAADNQTGPIPVDSPQDLLAICTGAFHEGRSYTSSAHYFLTQDIDLSGVAFSPLCVNGFQGVLDGKGHRIIDLDYASNDSNVGLFASGTRAAVVKNLVLDAPDISGHTNVGTIAGTWAGFISNVQVVGNWEARGQFQVGGLVGINRGSIENTYLQSTSSSDNVTASASGENFGGIAGVNEDSGVIRWAKLENINVDARNRSKSIEGIRVGGIVGDNFGLIQESSIVTPGYGITGHAHVGGIVGELSRSGTIMDSYVATGVWAPNSNDVGAIAGVTWEESSIERSLAAGNVKAKNDAHSLVGDHTGNMTSVFWDPASSDVTAESTSRSETASILFTKALDDTTRGDAATYAAVGWDLQNTWAQVSDEHPRLRNTGLSIAKSPVNVTATDGIHDTITVSWDPVPSARYYHVYRMLEDGVIPQQIATTSELSFKDQEVTLYNSYRYFVTASRSRSGAGESPLDQVSSDTGYALPAPDPTRIQGFLWHDLNENRVPDADEPRIVGATVYLDDNTNGMLDDGERQTITRSDDPSTPEDESGYYEFSGLKPGVHFVAQVLAPQLRQTFPMNDGRTVDPAVGVATFQSIALADQLGGAIASMADIANANPWVPSSSYRFLDGWNHSPRVPADQYDGESPVDWASETKWTPGGHAAYATQILGLDSLNDTSPRRYAIDFNGFQFRNASYDARPSSEYYGHEHRWYDGGDGGWVLWDTNRTGGQAVIAGGDLGDLYLDIDYGLNGGSPSIVGESVIHVSPGSQLFNELQRKWGTSNVLLRLESTSPPVNSDNVAPDSSQAWARFDFSMTLTPIPATSMPILVDNEQSVVGIGFGNTEFSWQNPVKAEDVNGDGLVTPVDVLNVILRLNRGGNGILDEPGQRPDAYVDVNRDSLLSPRDALLIINTLNDRDGEAESSLPVANQHGHAPRQEIASPATQGVSGDERLAVVFPIPSASPRNSDHRALFSAATNSVRTSSSAGVADWQCGSDEEEGIQLLDEYFRHFECTAEDDPWIEWFV